MDVFLLGAGRPAHGNQPSSLKNIALNARAMDWQLHSFDATADIESIHYLGGYQVDEVIACYPQLKYTVIPDWQNKSVLHTLMSGPFDGKPVLATYSDTVFRQDMISQMLRVDADVVYCVDSLWQNRYEQRSSEDIGRAETVTVELGNDKQQLVEFTGLVRFSAKAAQLISQAQESDIGATVLELIDYLKGYGLSTKVCDVTGHWAELNSVYDISRFVLGTKAETLARLEPRVKLSHIGKQVSFTIDEWKLTSEKIIERIVSKFDEERLIVRSSSNAEDGWQASNAGGFESLLNIDGSDVEAISIAIEAVIDSYGVDQAGSDQVLVQEFLSNVRAAGVVFTCGLENGAPYYRFNFDDKTQSTEAVTSGGQADLRTIVVSRFETTQLRQVEPELVPVLQAVQELEELLGYDKLDIEFAIDCQGVVHIFQVRPVTVNHDDYDVDQQCIESAVNDAKNRFELQQIPSPFVYGEKTILANMPDWNPAEIIGTRPKPLAFTLYRYLITNEVWAQQRAEFGYRDVRPYPLIISLAGQPYVDARASFNSFIPAGVSEATAQRLANAYISILEENPKYHDKVEFDVAFTVWTKDIFVQATQRLMPYGVSEADIVSLEISLKKLTCTALQRLEADTSSIKLLSHRRSCIEKSNLSVIDKIYSLLDDCKRFGTLAFSHAARAGFVATTLLNNLVATRVLAEERRLEFLQSFETVAGEFERDKQGCHSGLLSLEQLIEKYGHLRPGTYELAAQAYWEDPEKYIVLEGAGCNLEKEEFLLTSNEVAGFSLTLSEMGASISVAELLSYLKSAIQARESVKFEFTRNLSKALDLCVEYGKSVGIPREDLSFLEYNDIEQIKLNAVSSLELKKRIASRKNSYSISCSVELPPLIKNDRDLTSFERFSSQPNFISIKKIDALVQCLAEGELSSLEGKLVMIPQADPGYDWLFGHGISGLITKYGGANSHMAIRAAESGLPAAIGVGEKLYEKISSMRRVELDCANQVIRELK